MKYLFLTFLTLSLAACTPTPPNQAVPSQERVPQTNSVDEGTAPTQEQNANRYQDYSEEALAQATAQGTTVLFFHASWCPTCRAAEEQILKDPDAIPEDMTILKIDYDNAQELRSKYGITTQHTFVQVDKDGNEITKWVGGGLETIVQEIET